MRCRPLSRRIPTLSLRPLALRPVCGSGRTSRHPVPVPFRALESRPQCRAFARGRRLVSRRDLKRPFVMNGAAASARAKRKAPGSPDQVPPGQESSQRKALA
ncbi:hypothetical protein FALCPG4_006636 [Fusarium falciforme]